MTTIVAPIEAYAAEVADAVDDLARAPGPTDQNPHGRSVVSA